MKFELGKKYWYFSEKFHRSIIGEDEYNQLVECTFISAAPHYFTFEIQDTSKIRKTYNMSFGDLNDIDTIFLSKDHFLIHLVQTVDKLNRKRISHRDTLMFDSYDCDEFNDNTKFMFDDFMINEIEKSMERCPELWL